MLTTIIQPRFSDTDALGHITNTAIPVWFEHGRQELLPLIHPDMTYKDWPLLVAKIDATFIQQIFLGQPVKITTSISKIGTKSFDVFQQAFQNEQLVAEGNAVMVWFDPQQQKTQAVPEEIRARLASLLIKQ